MSGALALGGLTGGCVATRTSDSTGQYVDDTVITTTVKSALLGDEAVKSFAVSVGTVKGVVQLSGLVTLRLRSPPPAMTLRPFPG